MSFVADVKPSSLAARNSPAGSYLPTVRKRKGIDNRHEVAVPSHKKRALESHVQWHMPVLDTTGVGKAPDPLLLATPLQSLGESAEIACSRMPSQSLSVPWVGEEYSGLRSLNHDGRAKDVCPGYLDDDEILKLIREDPMKHEDELLALALQEQDNDHAAARLNAAQDKEKNMMLSTRCGRAVLFVEKVLTVIMQLIHQNGGDYESKISAVSRDDMVTLAERMMETQEKLRWQGKPTKVDLGYHYTSESCMKHIRTGGLLTKKERLEQKVGIRANGAVFGDGIYTANNPFCFRGFGVVGLLVARLQGVTRRVENFQLPERDGSFETIVGNKKRRQNHHGNRYAFLDHYDEVILLEPSQCVPLIRYSSKLIPQAIQYGGPYSETPLLKFHIEMQKLLDEFFNKNMEGSSSEAAVSCSMNPSYQLLRLECQLHHNTSAQLNPIFQSQPGTFHPLPIHPLHACPVTTNAVAASTNTANHTIGGPIPAVPTSSSSHTGQKQQKERMLMHTKVLVKYLAQEDPAMYERAKQVIKECAARNKRGDREYESLVLAMERNLKALVGERYWQRAEAYLNHFLARRNGINA